MAIRQTRPDQTAMSHKYKAKIEQIQTENTTNTNTKWYKQYKNTKWMKLRSTFGHQTDQPGQTIPESACNESKIQRQNTNNTNTKKKSNTNTRRKYAKK